MKKENEIKKLYCKLRREAKTYEVKLEINNKIVDIIYTIDGGDVFETEYSFSDDVYLTDEEADLVDNYLNSGGIGQ